MLCEQKPGGARSCLRPCSQSRASVLLRLSWCAAVPQTPLGVSPPHVCLANDLLPFSFSFIWHLGSSESVGILSLGTSLPVPLAHLHGSPGPPLGTPGSISRCPLGMATWAHPGPSLSLAPLDQEHRPRLSTPPSAVCVAGRGPAVIAVQCPVTSPQRLL